MVLAKYILSTAFYIVGPLSVVYSGTNAKQPFDSCTFTMIFNNYGKYDEYSSINT